MEERSEFILLSPSLQFMPIFFLGSGAVPPRDDHETISRLHGISVQLSPRPEAYPTYNLRLLLFSGQGAERAEEWKRGRVVRSCC